TMGKRRGGGRAVGAFGGRAEVMAFCDPRRPDGIHHAGTFNGNPLAMTGGAATLDLLDDDAFERLNGLGDRLREGIDQLGTELGLAVCATGRGSLLNIHLADEPPRRYRDLATRIDQDAAGLLHLAMLNEGLFMAR